jgi:hypothetical protein
VMQRSWIGSERRATAVQRTAPARQGADAPHRSLLGDRRPLTDRGGARVGDIDLAVLRPPIVEVICANS